MVLLKTAAAALSLLAVAPSVSAKSKNLRRKVQGGNGDCMEVITTGSAAPTYIFGLAGPGTLVTYGSADSGCRDGGLFQVDTGRGTGTRLSDLGMSPASIDVVMFTHMHSDHCDGFFSFMTDRFIRSATAGAGPVDVICSDDAVADAGYTVSCREYITHIGDPYLFSGEVAQRNFELAGAATLEGPAALANVLTFPIDFVDSRTMWVNDAGTVSIDAISTTHIPGSGAYRINTPVGAVAIGGDAGNDSSDVDTRPWSTSDQVELLATGADIVVNTAIHPRLVEEGSMFNPVLYFRQSNVPDLGGLAARAGVQVLFLTHLTPSIGATRSAGVPVIGGALTEDDFVVTAQEAGFDGIVVAATDLATVRVNEFGMAMVMPTPSTAVGFPGAPVPETPAPVAPPPTAPPAPLPTFSPGPPSPLFPGSPSSSSSSSKSGKGKKVDEEGGEDV